MLFTQFFGHLLKETKVIRFGFTRGAKTSAYLATKRMEFFFQGGSLKKEKVVGSIPVI